MEHLRTYVHAATSASPHRHQRRPNGHPLAAGRSRGRHGTTSRYSLSGADLQVQAVDRVAIAQALTSLSAVLREAVVLYHYGDLSYAEIAARQGVPIDTVKTRLFRAREKLAAQLKPSESQAARPHQVGIESPHETVGGLPA